MAGSETVIIALGSPYRGDDGVGPCVARRLGAQLPASIVVDVQQDSMAIVNAWEGRALAVVVDAAVSGAPPGTILRFEVDAKPLPENLSRCSSHGLGLAEAVELGMLLDRMPGRLVIYAVEAQTVAQGVDLSPVVAAAVDRVVRSIEAEVAATSRA